MNTVNTDLTKRPYQSQKMTREELTELAMCTVNPLHFIRNYCYIQHPTKGRMPFQLFDYQEGLINSYNDYRYSISLLSRQTGKSTCAAAYLLWLQCSSQTAPFWLQHTSEMVLKKS
jgi:hypothetical protein